METDPGRSSERAVLHAAVSRLASRISGVPIDSNWDPATAELRFQHRPGAGLSGIYRLPSGSGSALIGATTEALSARRGLIRIKLRRADTREKITVSGWKDPQDPGLPGLGTALDVHRVAEQWADGDRLVELRTIAYRPLRRAVIKVGFETRGPVHAQRTVFLKVQRLGQARPLMHRHLILQAAGLPVPAVLGEPHLHIVALAGMPGDSLGHALRADGAAGIEPAELIGLLDQLPAEVMELEARSAWSDKLHRYAQAAAATLPDHAEAIRELVAEIDEVLACSERGELVPTHGDFYESNLLVHGGQLHGLLDLDSLGPGYRVDDLACLLGHLGVLPSVGGAVGHLPGALERFGQEFSAAVDPAALWARAAAVAVSLIAGARTPGKTGWEAAALARLEAAHSLFARV